MSKMECMLIKLFGIMDLLSAILFILLKYNIGIGMAYIFVIYLIAKGLLFFGDFNSYMDIIIAGFMLLASQGIFIWVTWIFIFYLLQKAFFSLVA